MRGFIPWIDCLRNAAIAPPNWSGPTRSGLDRAQAEPFGPGVDMSEQLLTSSLHRTEKYFELLNERKIKGYLFQEKNSYPGNTAKSS